MESACKLLRRRMDEGKRVVPISCNFSRIHFTKENFPEQFEAVMDKYQIPKEYIEVEITETLVVEELQQHKVKETVEILRKKGIRLSIDDFGSGYSSLGVFEQIPASVIKARPLVPVKQRESRAAGENYEEYCESGAGSGRAGCVRGC